MQRCAVPLSCSLQEWVNWMINGQYNIESYFLVVYSMKSLQTFVLRHIFWGRGGAEYTLMSIHKLGGKYTPLPLYHVRWARSAVLRKTIERSLIFIRLFYNSFNTMCIFSWYSTMTTRLHGQPCHISMCFWCRHYHQCSNLLLVWSVIVVVA